MTRATRQNSTLRTKDATGTYASINWSASLARLTQSASLIPPVSTEAFTGMFYPVQLAPITGGDSVQYGPTTTAVTRLHTLDVPVSQGGRNYVQNQVSGQSGAGAAYHATEFDYYGADFAIGFRAAQNFNSWVWVWVDGRPLTASPVVLAAPFAGDPQSYRVQLTAGAKWRRIRIYMANGDFGGIDCGANDVVNATPRPGLRVAVLGDSYTTGTGAANPLLGFPILLGILLNAEVYACGIGGSGYIAGSPPFSDTTRTTPIGTVQPDDIIVAGSINDNASSAAAVGAAATSLYATLKALCPKARLHVSTVQANNGTMSAANIANGAAVKAAAQAAGAVSITDPIGEAWVTGTGKANLLPPVGVRAAQSSSSGGTFGAGTYYYVATATNGVGETTAGSEVSATVVANGQIQVNWVPASTANGSKLYRGTSASAENTLVYTGTGSSFTDTGITGTVSSPPGSNNTGVTGTGTGRTLVAADSTHPSGPGQENFARRIGVAFLTALASYKP